MQFEVELYERLERGGRIRVEANSPEEAMHVARDRANDAEWDDPEPYDPAEVVGVKPIDDPA